MGMMNEWKPTEAETAIYNTVFDMNCKSVGEIACFLKISVDDVEHALDNLKAHDSTKYNFIVRFMEDKL